jgi:hypothetical protein
MTGRGLDRYKFRTKAKDMLDEVKHIIHDGCASYFDASHAQIIATTHQPYQAKKN